MSITPTIWTVGHSTRPLGDFLELLGGYEIELVADVRRFPGSRRHPQYQQAALESALAVEGIAYSWFPSLGGRRRATHDDTGSGWRHPAFRGYAEHIAGEEFAGGLFELMMQAEGARTAMMCAELLWWRCHRRMIADVLVSLGIRVIHILDGNTAAPHRLAGPARVVRGVLSYASRSSVAR